MTTGVHQPSPLFDKSAESAACLGFQARAYEWRSVGILRSDCRSDADNHTIAGKGRSAIFICFVLIAFLLLPLMARTASAEPGLDLVVVIDQSNSMQGKEPWKRAANDPEGHRAAALEFLASGMGAHVGGNNSVHRLSVVEYGSESRLIIDGHEIKHDPADPLAAVNSALRQSTQIRPKCLVFTNTPAALKEGLEASQRLAAKGSDPTRKRVLLLITDGRPYAEVPNGSAGASGNCSDPYVENPEGKQVPLEVMRKEITKTVESLQSNGVEFGVIGLNDSSNYWNQAKDGQKSDGDFWRKLAGGEKGAPLAENSHPALARLIQKRLDGWLGVKSITASGQQFTVDPFVIKLIVKVGLPIPLEKVALKDPAGNYVPLTAGARPGNPAIYAQYLLNDPLPGVYTVEVDTPGSGTDKRSLPTIDYQITGPRLRLLQPSGPVTVGIPVNLVAQAYGNDSSRPLPFPAPYPELTVELTGPAGKVTSVRLTTADGIQFAGSFTPGDVGAYKPSASLRTISGRAIELADGGRLDDLTVSAAPPPRLSLVAPILTEVQGVSPLSPGVRVQVELELVDNAGTALKPADIDGLLVSPDQWLSLRPLDASGVPSGSPIPLKRREGRFEVDWPVDFQFSRGEGILRPALIHARIDQSPKALAPNAVVAPGIALPAEVIGNRIAGDPSTIANVSVRISWPWLAALAILLLLVITAIVIPLLLILRRQLSIGRQDRIYRDLALRIYDPLVGPISGTGIKIPLAGKTVHKLDSRYSIRDGAAQRSLRRLIVTRNLDATPPRVEIVYQLDQAMTVSRTTVQFGKPPQSLTGTFTNSFVFELLSQRPAAPP
jgi:hypothetical protein